MLLLIINVGTPMMKYEDISDIFLFHMCWKCQTILLVTLEHSILQYQKVKQIQQFDLSFPKRFKNN